MKHFTLLELKLLECPGVCGPKCVVTGIFQCSY